MALPVRAKLIVALAAVGGLAASVSEVVLARPHGLGALTPVALLTSFILASWLWPLVMYKGEQSEAHHLDEGIFVVMALLLHPAGTIAGFTLAMAVTQVIRRPPLVKSVFNFGMILLSVSLALMVVRVIAAPASPLSVTSLVAAVAGAVVFSLLNRTLVAAVIAASGDHRFVTNLRDGLRIHLLLLGACAVLGLMTALAAGVHLYFLLLGGLAFLILRQVLAGHFQSRHDRERLDGLFAATLAAHASIGAGEVTGALLDSARSLLRCSDARLLDTEPPAGMLAMPIDAGGQRRWLGVDGRSRAEPFDSADRSLLETLAAVGAGALTNAALYEEGQHQRERIATITSSLGEGVCAFDAVGAITFVNPAAEAMLGWNEQELVAASRSPPDSPGRPEFLIGPAQRAIAQALTVRVEDSTFWNAAGIPFPVAFTCSPVIEDDVASGAVVVFRDISEHKAFEERLAHRAFHDALTGLPNRRLFLDRLEHALHRNQRQAPLHAVLFADVDRFKIVNDSLGHRAGDHLLQAIVERLSRGLRAGDTLARFGGDEFTVLLEDINGVEDAEGVATRMVESLEAPIQLEGGYEVVARVSIGIALTTGLQAADDVLHDADAAMYQAKAHKIGGYQVFDAAAMQARSVERFDLEADLRRALDNHEMEVYFQPMFSSETFEIVGAEALVRWNHPLRGLLAPGHFIGVAEETGLILPLGRQVMEQACVAARGWVDHRGDPLSTTVNLSTRQFLDPYLVRDMMETLEKTGVPPSQICIEITESLAVDDVDRTDRTLSELKALGLRIAIDDFGTGFSSLKYLKQFPADIVKIDQSFVHGLEASPVDSAIVSAVINLAKAIGMTTVAEGVETVPQLDHLRTMGCPVIQGYLFSRPIRAEALTKLLDRRSVDTVSSVA